MNEPPILRTQAPEAVTGTASPYRRTALTAREPAFRPQTPLGQELWKLRERIVASGEPFLDENQIEEEVDRRRGGARVWDQ